MTETTSFDELVVAYRDRLVTVAQRIVLDRQAAEDIAQETLLVAWRNLDELRDPRALGAWLASIARNKAKMMVRKLSRESLCADPELLTGPRKEPATPYDDKVDKEGKAHMQRLLDELPPGYREPIVLFYYHLCSVKQISERLGISNAAVKQRLSRGREKLRFMMRPASPRSIAARHRSPRRQRNASFGRARVECHG